MTSSDASTSTSSSSTSILGETFSTAIAGGLSGCISKTFTAPLSRITILYQVHGTSSWPSSNTSPSQSHGSLGLSNGGLGGVQTIMRPAPAHLIDAMKLVVKREGILSLWKGNLATILHRLPYSAVNFVVFEQSDKLMGRLMRSEHHKGKKVGGQQGGARGGIEVRKFLAGGLAGVAGCSAAYPLDLVRTRIAASLGSSSSSSSSSGYGHHRYKGVSHALVSIIKEEGWVGLYRGLPATLTQVSPALALNFGFYSNFKLLISSSIVNKDLDLDLGAHGSSAEFSPLVSTAAASLAGLCSSTMTFPLDKIRRLVQMEAASVGGSQGEGSSQRGWRHHAVSIWKRGGIKAFYAGIAAEYLKVVPGMVVAFTTFEFLKQALGVKGDQIEDSAMSASAARSILKGNKGSADAHVI